MLHPRHRLDHSSPPETARPHDERDTALEGAVAVSHLPIEQLLQIQVEFSAFRQAHPHSGLSLLDFALQHLSADRD